jgi:uncharacterized protein (DUF1015 family)
VQTLPSDPRPGVALEPFRGIRYSQKRVSGIANVTSPPYDVISNGSLAHLQAADPHNVVRLILPGTGAEAPGAAAALLAQWLSDGVLIRDRAPALYLYEQAASSWRQRGIIGLVKLGTPESAGILPHEGVMPGPVAGRRLLMAATEANLEPIFLVYDGEAERSGHSAPTATQIVDGVANLQTPLLSIQTEDGVMHRLWRLADEAENAAIAADLAGRRALIADGHHRYAAYLELQAEMREAGRGSGPWDYGLAFLVDSAASPPRLGAIHRVLPALDLERAAELAKAAFTVQSLPAAGGLDAAMRGLADAGRYGTAFLLAGHGAEGNEPSASGTPGHGIPGHGIPGHGAASREEASREEASREEASRWGYYLLSQPDPVQVAASMPPGTSPHWQALDASVLQQFLLSKLWGITDNEQDVLIYHDAAEAIAAVGADKPGSCPGMGTAVILNPVPFEAVRGIAEHGERVPRKSTSFGPKPRTGLVLRTFGPHPPRPSAPSTPHLATNTPA